MNHPLVSDNPECFDLLMAAERVDSLCAERHLAGSDYSDLVKIGIDLVTVRTVLFDITKRISVAMDDEREQEAQSDVRYDHYAAAAVAEADRAMDMAE